MKYEYNSLLPPGQIRLLTIIPDDGIAVSTKLHIVKLDDNPVYRCLSYTWSGPDGDGTSEIWTKPTESVLIDGLEMPIRRNLHNALIALRQSGTLGPIWIDALCINQEDIEERNIQVSQMARIYKDAEEVVVWLGHEEAYTREAVANMERVYVSRQDLLSDDFVRIIDDAFTACHFTDLDMVGIARFFSEYAWFGRTWTLQEMWLARNMRFICGRISASLDVILAGSSVAHTCYVFCSIYEDIKATAGHTWLTNFIYDLMAKLKDGDGNVDPVSIGFEASYHRERHATDPRDKVYGLLAISDTNNDRIGSIVADYSKSVQEVFSTAAAHCLLDLPHWKGLGSIGDRNEYNIQGLPSWVPDYTQAVPWRLLRRSWTDMFKTAIHGELNISYDISSPYTLSSPYHHFDTITALTTAHWEDYEGYPQMIEILNLVLNPFHIKTPNNDNIIRVLTRTLTADQAGLYDETGYDFFSQFEEMLYSMLWLNIAKKDPVLAKELLQDPEISLSEALSLIGIHNAPELVSTLLQPYRYLYQTEQQINAEFRFKRREMGYTGRHQKGQTSTSSIRLDWGSASENRCLFRTERGHLGLAPRTAQVGDQVGILQGAEVPHVFRQISEDSENDLTLVGDAYVYGIMYGELESEKLEYKVITLH
ncbi:hypothetical protein FSARC_3829 [Fusarium sarcochroum]|uniref:Heterokaryon incompatibility domain-containing protein n=1 Tax=Fusarium sarcochroum TaxID=1208366 RepID=A0A8H4U338_9HYPO|nr:hypothetical protein FSARC_3829 [Fusarium sarcochroum]